MNDKSYFRGRATITEKLNIELADEGFKSFLGEDSVYKLGKSVYPKDMHRLEAAFETAKSGESTMATVRLTNGKEGYRWVVMSVRLSKVGETEAIKDRFGTLFDVTIQDISAYKETIQALECSNNCYMEYLSLMEHLLFSCDARTGKLRIFMMGSHQQVDFYNGTLEDWRQSKLEKGEVDDGSRNVFEQLCEDFKGTEIFEHEIRMRLLGDSQRMEQYLIKGKAIADDRGGKRIIATVSIVSTDTSGGGLFSVLGAKDAGTDLLNKRAITSYARKLLESEPDYPVTIVVMDIDNFKLVNDQYGHMLGDEVIRAVAGILKEAVEGKGVAGRIGGDEMFLVLEGLNTDEELRSVLRTIKNNVAWLYNNCIDKPNVTCSIGTASYPADAREFDELFKIADKMLYLAKEKGKNRYVIYRSDLHEEYLSGKGRAKDDAQSFYKYRRITVANKIINDFYRKGEDRYAKAAEMIHFAFDIDSIFLYEKAQDGNWSRNVIYGEDIPPQACDFIKCDNYLADFNEENVKIINNINFIEKNNNTAYREFTQMGICQAVQFLIREENIPDRVVSFNRNKQVSQWSDKDIMYLVMYGNLFGMGYGDD